ncbi:hypothetical protein FY047_01310 [Leclercia adecarboxylata]|nr:hypothetical protein FTX45_01450 [Leclercia adecarboxylata]QIG31423.1 hypothetical protein FY047_01310 [Leclercia adecarboxylata]
MMSIVKKISMRSLFARFWYVYITGILPQCISLRVTHKATRCVPKIKTGGLSHPSVCAVDSLDSPAARVERYQRHGNHHRTDVQLTPFTGDDTPDHQ